MYNRLNIATIYDLKSLLQRKIKYFGFMLLTQKRISTLWKYKDHLSNIK